jgi:hypothetical protein
LPFSASVTLRQRGGGFLIARIKIGEALEAIGGKYEAVWDNFTQRTLKWLKV